MSKTSDYQVKKSTVKDCFDEKSVKYDIFKIFEECFPYEDIESSFPFKDDVIYLIYDNDTMVGFAVIHNCPPYKFKNVEKSSYLYNLGIGVSYRFKGFGDKLLKKIKSDNDIITCHARNSTMVSWLKKRNFVCSDRIRITWREMVYNPDNTDEYDNCDECYEKDIAASDLYCEEGNFFYMQ